MKGTVQSVITGFIVCIAIVLFMRYGPSEKQVNSCIDRFENNTDEITLSIGGNK